MTPTAAQGSPTAFQQPREELAVEVPRALGFAIGRICRAVRIGWAPSRTRRMLWTDPDDIARARALEHRRLACVREVSRLEAEIAALSGDSRERTLLLTERLREKRSMLMRTEQGLTRERLLQTYGELERAPDRAIPRVSGQRVHRPTRPLLAIPGEVGMRDSTVEAMGNEAKELVLDPERILGDEPGFEEFGEYEVR